MKDKLLVGIILLAAQALSAQWAVVAVTADEPGNHHYRFAKYEEDGSPRKQGLDLFIADSARFHKENRYHHQQSPHVCENRFNMVGWVDEEHKTILPFEYDYLQPINDSFLVAGKDNLTGIINNRGKVIVPFDRNELASKDNEFFVFKNKRADSTILFYDTNGSLSFTTTGYSAARVGQHHFNVFYKGGRFKGVVDDKGKWAVTPGMYDYVHWIENGFVCAVRNGRLGIVTFKGKLILPFENDHIKPGVAGQFIVSKNGLQGLVNIDNNVVIPFDQRSIEQFGNIYLTSRYRTGLYGLVNANGTQLLAGQYALYRPAAGSVGVQKNGLLVAILTDTGTRLQGMYRSDGVRVLPIEYNNIMLNPDSKVFIAMKISVDDRVASLYGAVDLDGREVVPFSINRLSFVNRSPNLLLATNTNNRSAFVNANTGQVFTTFDYEYVAHENILYNGYAALKKNWKYALVSPEGRLITDAVYTNFYVAKANDQLFFEEPVVCLARRMEKLYGITKAGKELERRIK